MLLLPRLYSQHNFSFCLVLFSRCGGVSLAVRGCGLNRFLPPIILNVCVCVRRRACVNVDMSTYCPFQVSKCTFTLSYTHTCILPKLTQSVCRTPNHDYKLKCEELFFCLFVFGVALFYTCTFYLLFFLDFHKMMEHQRTLCPATNWDFTHCQEVLLWGEKRRPKQTQIESEICA